MDICSAPCLSRLTLLAQKQRNTANKNNTDNNDGTLKPGIKQVSFQVSFEAGESICLSEVQWKTIP